MTLPKNWSHTHNLHVHTHSVRCLGMSTESCMWRGGKLSMETVGVLWEWIGEVCFSVTCYVEGGVIARGAGW